MTATTTSKRNYTQQEYFDIIRSSDAKLEYRRGTVYALAGGSIEHNRIKDKLTTEILRRDFRCRYYSSDTAVYVEREEAYYFPDMSFICGDPSYTDQSIEQITNPTLIVEVLSNSTEAKDRGEKFHSYFSLPSFVEYVLIESQTIRIDVFRRNGPGSWSMRSYSAPEEEVELQTLGVSIPLSAIYEDVAT